MLEGRLIDLTKNLIGQGVWHGNGIILPSDQIRKYSIEKLVEQVF